METFYAQFVIEEEHLLYDLLSVPKNRPDLHIPLISRVMLHYAEYSNRLSQLADRDITMALSSYWLTPLECTFVWLGGPKPSLLCRFMPSDLDDDQRREIVQLRQSTIQREAVLEAIMRDVHETNAILMAMVATLGNARNGEFRALQESRVAVVLRRVFDAADRLRKHVVSRIVQVLDTAQTVHFLASLANHRLSIRQFGLQRVGWG